MLTSYERRKFRVRSSVIKNNKGRRPRVVVFRSNKNTHAQLISMEGMVLASFSSVNLNLESSLSGLEKAKLVGKSFAEICVSKNLIEVVFEKGAYLYNGRIKALAESCRESGLKF